MLQVRIKAIGRRGILSEENYCWMIEHLNMPLQVMSLNVSQGDDEPWSITVYKEDGEIVSLFTDTNRLEYEFVGVLGSNFTRVVDIICVNCGVTHSVRVPINGYKNWQSGRQRIQDAMPNVSDADREMLMSHLCPTCWDVLFKED